MGNERWEMKGGYNRTTPNAVLNPQLLIQVGAKCSLPRGNISVISIIAIEKLYSRSKNYPRDRKIILVIKRLYSRSKDYTGDRKLYSRSKNYTRD